MSARPSDDWSATGGVTTLGPGYPKGVYIAECTARESVECTGVMVVYPDGPPHCGVCDRILRIPKPVAIDLPKLEAKFCKPSVWNMSFESKMLCMEITDILKRSRSPLGASHLAARLRAHGYHMSDRNLRKHMLKMQSIGAVNIDYYSGKRVLYSIGGSNSD